jgi:DNA polymerase V
MEVFFLNNKVYLCIDLKSFYASVECMERGLDPLKTNLVVADSSRTEKTICLAVSPSLKQYGIPGRARLFEVVQKVKEVNDLRKKKYHINKFSGKSYDDTMLRENHKLEIDYITATPRMGYYLKYSTNIYNVYLKYLAPEDIHVYSIDEVFCDITSYLKFNNVRAKELATIMIKDVYETTGITATAGIGTNMYLAKVAMDIVAKKCKPNEYGVRIAGLDEKLYRKLLWEHKPLSDFWRVGKGYVKRLEDNNMFTMGDVARCSIENEDLLYKLFGVNAELLIDHAWGIEPCCIKDIKSYKPTTNCITSGQVLHCPYDFSKTKLIIKEMTDLLVLDLVEKHYVTDNISLTVGYDIDNLTGDKSYFGEVTTDHYGRKVPKPAHGTIRLDYKTSSTKIIMNAVTKLFDKIVDKNLLVRRVNISFNGLVREENIKEEKVIEQYDLFTDYEKLEKDKKIEKENQKIEKKLQETMIDIKKKYGKNSILKAMNLEEGATTIERNSQIGGHKE